MEIKINKGIEFIQYLRPDGRKELQWIERAVDVELKASRIRSAGYVFEIEVLMNGMVSMTVEKSFSDDGPIAHKVIANGPPVLVAVDNLVCDAFQHLLKLGKVQDVP